MFNLFVIIITVVILFVLHGTFKSADANTGRGRLTQAGTAIGAFLTVVVAITVLCS